MNSSSELFQLADKQAKVVGRYHDVAFEGLAISSRWDSAMNCEVITIQLTTDLDIRKKCKRLVKAGQCILMWGSQIDRSTHFVKEQ